MWIWFDCACIKSMMENQEFKRRNFLKQSVLAATVLAVPGIFTGIARADNDDETGVPASPVSGENVWEQNYKLNSAQNCDVPGTYGDDAGDVWKKAIAQKGSVAANRTPVGNPVTHPGGVEYHPRQYEPVSAPLTAFVFTFTPTDPNVHPDPDPTKPKYPSSTAGTWNLTLWVNEEYTVIYRH